MRKVDKISDYYDETLFLDIPNGKNVKLFCQKVNNSNCIYFDESNEVENSVVGSPILAVFCSLFLIVIELFFMKNLNHLIQIGKRSYSTYCFRLWIALSGICILGWQILDYYNYNKLIKQDNITTGFTYSEIYIKYGTNFVSSNKMLLVTLLTIMNMFMLKILIKRQI